MLLKNACKIQQTYVRKTDEHGPKMVPKSLQNRSWRRSGAHLGAILETRCCQDLIFDDFGSILGPPLGPVWGHFGHHFFDVFLKCLFEGFGLHLGSQNTSRMRPKRVPKPRPEDRWFWFIYCTLATFRGAENHNFSVIFWSPLLGGLLGSHFDDFGSLWGSPLDVILVMSWVPFLHRFLNLPKTPNKRQVSSAPSSLNNALSPPPRTPSPS